MVIATGARAVSFFAQRISIVEWRGNAANVLATMPHGPSLYNLLIILILLLTTYINFHFS